MGTFGRISALLPHGERERGQATAEFAVGLPAVVLMLSVMIGLLQAMLVHHQALHAASVGARVAARGESAVAIRTAASRAGPNGAQISTSKSAGMVSVRVTPHVPAGVRWALPDLSAQVSSVEERDVDGEGPT